MIDSVLKRIGKLVDKSRDGSEQVKITMNDLGALYADHAEQAARISMLTQQLECSNGDFKDLLGQWTEATDKLRAAEAELRDNNQHIIACRAVTNDMFKRMRTEMIRIERRGVSHARMHSQRDMFRLALRDLVQENDKLAKVVLSPESAPVNLMLQWPSSPMRERAVKLLDIRIGNPRYEPKDDKESAENEQ